MTAARSAAPAPAADDPIICYCFNKTRRDLEDAHRRCGSVAKLQDETRVGTNCGGCRLLLESMFGEAPDEIMALRGSPLTNPRFCNKPGVRIMKGFVIADHELDTRVYASNGVPPQFGGQDTTIPIEYALLDAQGRRVAGRTLEWKTHETFCFDTALADIPRPLHGMFLLKLGRVNYGAARFNLVWGNGVSSCSTHEVNDSGRPSVVLPLFADRAFLEGPNTVYVASQNPHSRPITVRYGLFDEGNRRLADFPVVLEPGHTRWFDANAEFYAPALERSDSACAALRIETDPVDVSCSPTTYFFFHNRNTGIWTANHL
jgi:bacterioferritin-associated ferredoxin